MIQFQKVPKGGKIVNEFRFPHPLDAFLYTVLVEFPDEEGYAVWDYNSQHFGYSNGSYFNFPDEGLVERQRHAQQEFLRRFERRMRSYFGEDWNKG